ncbi:LysR family transcriptional regulator [Loigolactobacillus iwatensis]|uniref:LysR family transcriptional regulator n=1 Tax=Loigolactobacillus iwatensis TaxID=1267156 RepID=UPI000F7EE516|nr:LysR family transcriptional regulator [Loigolactobacillus iwatensis]
MNTRDLEYFAALAQQRNFTLVAKKFQVTQPTITLAIKRLESQTNQQLVIRDQSHHSIALTAAGHIFANHIAVILNELAQTKQDLAAIQPTKIRFGLPPIIGINYFPQFTPALAAANLLTSITTTEGGSADLLEKLKRGDIDIALLGSIDPIDHPGITAKLLARQPFEIIAPGNSHWAEQTPIYFKDVAREPFIMLASGFVHPQAFARLAKASQTSPEIVYHTGDINLIKNMVQQGVGLGFLAQTAIHKNDDLLAITLADADQPHFNIYVAYRANQVLTPEKQRVIEILSGPENS